MTPFTEGILQLSPRADSLLRRGANLTSQFGEDGLIEASLDLFGVANRWCFEVGAADGLFYSNTHRLRLEGWSAVLIEADAGHYDNLRKLASPTVWTVPEKINTRSLDRILKECGAPRDIDLGVIDIDGQEWWIWNELRDFRPRLMLIEFDYKSEDKGIVIPACDGTGQASYEAMIQLGMDLGYEPLAKTLCNLLFADKAIL